MNRIQVTALALAATTIVASGCGGSIKPSSNQSSARRSNTSTPINNPPQPNFPTGPLTRSQVIAQGDVICSRLHHKGASTRGIRIQGYAAVLPVLAAYEYAAVAQMRKLIPPRSMAGGWKQMVSSVQTIADATNAMAGYARAKRFAETKPLIDEAFNAQERLLSVAKREGFKECSQRF